MKPANFLHGPERKTDVSLEFDNGFDSVGHVFTEDEEGGTLTDQLCRTVGERQSSCFLDLLRQVGKKVGIQPPGKKLKRGV